MDQGRWIEIDGSRLAAIERRYPIGPLSHRFGRGEAVDEQGGAVGVFFEGGG